MSYRIVIEKDNPDDDHVPAKIYEQTVEEIDLHAVMSAVNKRPRKPRGRQANAKDEPK